jgi:hypothetical protein
MTIGDRRPGTGIVKITVVGGVSAVDGSGEPSTAGAMRGQLDLPVRTAEEMQVVLLEEAISVAPSDLLDQLARDQELDRVAGPHGCAVAQRRMCHKGLLVVRREVEIARHGDGDRDRPAR